MYTEKQVEDELNSRYDEKSPKYDEKLNIAIIGKVSAGKSSLLNAILGCDKLNKQAPVGAVSGVTTGISKYKLGDNVLIMDSPGLSDIRKENSQVTKDFLAKVDVGIFVVTGSADAGQKDNYDDLKATCKKIIVVLNKIDEWNKQSKSLEKVVKQWHQVLGLLENQKIFPTCSFGYDPDTDVDVDVDLRGIDELRGELFAFLETEGKALLLAKHLKNKNIYANRIITLALGAVAAEAFLPGSSIYITATQAIAIASLYYLYKGEVLSKSSALAMMPTFIAQGIGSNIFLLVKSFLPPTGVLDAAAAFVAAGLTFGMLKAVAWMLENGHSLDDKALLAAKFLDFRKSYKIEKK